VGYDKSGDNGFDFDFDPKSETTTLISNVYTNCIVKYQVKDNKVEESTTEKVVYGNAITKEK
jgi:hypothetical protein